MHICSQTARETEGQRPTDKSITYKEEKDIRSRVRKGEKDSDGWSEKWKGRGKGEMEDE